MSTTRILNVEPSPYDERDYPFLADTAAALPSRYAVPGLGPRLDQGSTGTCVAHAATGVRHWQERRDGHGWIPVDIYRFYDLIKQRVDRQPDPHRVLGTTLRSALRLLAGTGTPLRGNLMGGKIKTYWRVLPDEASIKRAILARGPVLARCDWDANWMKLPLNRVLRSPLGRIVGGHAFYIYGWDDRVNGGSWLIRNSWGRWSIAGTGNAYMAFRYIRYRRPEVWASTDIDD